MSTSITGTRRGGASSASTKSKTKNSKTKKQSATTFPRADVSSGYFLLLILVAVLCVFGSMMVLSSSSIEALRIYGSSWLFFKRQLVWLAIGIAALCFTLRVDYQHWRKWSGVLLAASVGLLLLVLIPGIGIEVSGSRRWLGAGPLRMQPSEIAKFALLVFGADLLARRVDAMDNWRVSLRPVLLVFGLFMALVMLQPDMGTTMILGAITFALVFVGGARLRHLGALAGAGIAGGTLLAIVEPYRRARLMSFVDPFSDASDGGYQVVQSLVGIGSGGITGMGLGASRAKWGFLPNAHTDFIFAIIGEELGLIGAVSVVLLFVGFAILGVRAATRAPDRFGLLLAAGITAWVVFQAFLNIGAVISILPVTGVPLPFLSQGGSSLVVLMAATGILLNVARQGESKAGKRRAS